MTRVSIVFASSIAAFAAFSSVASGQVPAAAPAQAADTPAAAA
jgi:hypothetical protein